MASINSEKNSIFIQNISSKEHYFKPEYDTKFPLNDYKIYSLLGQGGFNYVYLLKKNSSNNENNDYIIRMTIPDAKKNRTIYEMFKLSLQSLSILNEKINYDNDNIKDDDNKDLKAENYLPITLQYGKYYHNKDTTGDEIGYYCIQKREKEELFNLVRENIFMRVDSNIIRDIFIKIVRGFKILHCLRVFHNDIKTENIMISNYDEDNITKEAKITIIDFDMGVLDSRITHGEENNTKLFKTQFGTPEMYSPEKIAIVYNLPNSGYNYKSDIWVLGVLYHELLVNKLPFNLTRNRLPEHKKIKNKTKIMVFKKTSDNISEDDRHIIDECLLNEASLRPTYDELLKLLGDNEWIDKFNEQFENDNCLASLRDYIIAKKGEDLINKYVHQLQQISETNPEYHFLKRDKNGSIIKNEVNNVVYNSTKIHLLSNNTNVSSSPLSKPNNTNSYKHTLKPILEENETNTNTQKYVGKKVGEKVGKKYRPPFSTIKEEPNPNVVSGGSRKTKKHKSKRKLTKKNRSGKRQTKSKSTKSIRKLRKSKSRKSIKKRK